MRALPKDKRLIVIGLLQHGCPNCWVSLNLHVLGFVESVFLMWSLQEEGNQEASPLLSNECV